MKMRNPCALHRDMVEVFVLRIYPRFTLVWLAANDLGEVLELKEPPRSMACQTRLHLGQISNIVCLHVQIIVGFKRDI